MKKRELYFCITISFISMSVLALHYESFWAGVAALFLLTVLYEDRHWYLEQANKFEIPTQQEERELTFGPSAHENGSEFMLRPVSEYFNDIGMLYPEFNGVERIIEEEQKNKERDASLNKMRNDFWAKPISSKKGGEISIVISEHAKERMEKRLKCNTQKQRKIVRKAWKSKEIVSPEIYEKIIKSEDAKPGDDYRYYLGFIFIFRDRNFQGVNKKMLITVYNPKHLYDVHDKIPRF